MGFIINGHDMNMHTAYRKKKEEKKKHQDNKKKNESQDRTGRKRSLDKFLLSFVAVRLNITAAVVTCSFKRFHLTLCNALASNPACHAKVQM